jgi:tetratricopeptide (TPR) repeat protein
MGIATRRILSLALALSCPSWPVAAVAQEAPPGAEADAAGAPSRHALQKARQHYDAGTRHYAEANYGAALAEFLEAYRLSHLPDLLYNLGKVAEKMGDQQGAADYLRRYLAERPDAPDATSVRAEIVQLDAAANERTAYVAPVSVHPPWPALGLLGGGTVLLLVGGGLSIGATNDSGAVIDRLQANPFDSSVTSLQNQSRSLGTAGIALDAVGAVAVVAGLVWTGVWFAQRSTRSPLQARLQPGKGAFSFVF